MWVFSFKLRPLYRLRTCIRNSLNRRLQGSQPFFKLRRRGNYFFPANNRNTILRVSRTWASHYTGYNIPAYWSNRLSWRLRIKCGCVIKRVAFSNVWLHFLSVIQSCLLHTHTMHKADNANAQMYERDSVPSSGSICETTGSNMKKVYRPSQRCGWVSRSFQHIVPCHSIICVQPPSIRENRGIHFDKILFKEFALNIGTKVSCCFVVSKATTHLL